MDIFRRIRPEHHGLTSDTAGDFTFINIIRIAGFTMIAALVATYSARTVFVLVSLAFILLSLIWLIVDKRNSRRPAYDPGNTFFPTTLDILFITYFAVVTGNTGSFLIGGYYYVIVVGAANRRKNFGPFAFAVSSAAMLGMSVCSYLRILPEINLIGPHRDISLRETIFTFGVWFFGGFSICRIVSELTKRELALSEKFEEEKHNSDRMAVEFSTYLEQSPVSTIITDKDGTIVQVNRKAEEISGYPAEELIGKNPRLLQSGRTPDSVYREMWDTISGGGVWHGEFVNRNRHGCEYLEKASISPIRDATGRIVKYLAVKEDITERKRAEFLLKESEAKYRLIAENTQDIIWKLDLSTLRYTWVSPSVHTIRGLTVAEALEEPFEASLTPESYFRAVRKIDEFRRIASTDPNASYFDRFRQPCKDGRIIETEVSASILRNQAGEPVEILGISRDVTQRNKSQEQDETIRLLLREFKENGGDRIWELDGTGIFTVFPDEFCRIFSKSEELLRHTHIIEAFADTYPEGSSEDTTKLDNLSRLLALPRPFTDAAVRVWTGGSSRYWILTGKPSVSGEGVITGWKIVSRDATANIIHTEELERHVYSDGLTGLPNLAAFRRTLDGYFESPRSGEESALLTLIHMENFKTVNSVYGYRTGDEVLKITARRIRFFAGETHVFAARTGGSDFACFKRHASPPSIDEINSLLQNLREPMIIPAGTIELVVRAGSVFLGPETADTEKAYKSAEFALNHACADRQNGTRIYDSVIEARQAREHETLLELETALERKEFLLLYQPQVEAASNRVIGAEALIRWNNRILGKVNPGDFIPVAERNGHMISIGAWIQQQACRDALAWNFHWSVAVNVSAVQLMNRNFFNSVVRILEITGFPPERLKLEITESSLIGDGQRAGEHLRLLREHGIRISLDDFGTGFSSLSLLKDLPIDELKIDQSFIRSMDGMNQSTAIVDTVIRLAGNLGLVVTAEGVENSAQADLLRRLGCNFFQGFLYSRPVPQEKILELDGSQPEREPSGPRNAIPTGRIGGERYGE